MSMHMHIIFIIHLHKTLVPYILKTLQTFPAWCIPSLKTWETFPAWCVPSLNGYIRKCLKISVDPLYWRDLIANFKSVLLFYLNGKYPLKAIQLVFTMRYHFFHKEVPSNTFKDKGNPLETSRKLSTRYS